MARGIKLKRFQIKEANHLEIHGFRLRVEVIDTFGDIDPNIFIFRRSPADAFTGVVTDEFMTVASFPDLSYYPIGTPDPAKSNPFFLARNVELDFKSVRDYNESWIAIRDQVAILCRTMDKAEQLIAIDEIWCGAVPPGAHASDSLSDGSLTSLGL